MTISAPKELLELSRMAVPRYTSYPTAPHFSSDVSSTTYSKWLRATRDAGEPISLYLHVPFCQELCSYCGCSTKATRRQEPVRAYAAVLHQEIELLHRELGRISVKHIHWGGGTPNILPKDVFSALLDDLKSRFVFTDDMEHAIELDPRFLTADGAQHLAGCGVTRVSLGIQTLDPKVQRAITRVQPLERVEAAFKALRAAGIRQINADLMYGLPFQSETSIEDTMREVARLRPDRLAVFGYAHVPWMKKHQTLFCEADLPDAAARLAQARLARKLLVAAGYDEIGIDHFAVPEDELSQAAKAGTLRRNFQGYTTDTAETLVGIGASSISKTASGYAQNAPDVRGWQRMVEAGELPIARGRLLENDDVLRSSVIEDILCSFRVNLAQSELQEAGIDGTDPILVERLAPLADKGWVEVTRDGVEIRQHPYEIARIVASAFDAYLGTGGRHSSAV
ncbi:MAG: oxygen-independent coproporphyrinogen III oxidase [Rhodobacteraceae bacterium]|nr:oxygen-independent coproporphyrinogen III oxidase [Paracoccaceae bacterium]